MAQNSGIILLDGRPVGTITRTGKDSPFEISPDIEMSYERRYDASKSLWPAISDPMLKDYSTRPENFNPFQMPDTAVDEVDDEDDAVRTFNLPKRRVR